MPLAETDINENKSGAKIPELLAPVGSMECMYAAVNNGCDAIYLGGKNFSARSSAQNFTISELERIIDYCKVRGVKTFIAINTLYRNEELKMLEQFTNETYEAGADAFIMQDIGTASFIRKEFPCIRLHASTQMTVGDAAGAAYMKKLGFDRVVLARESSFETIRSITGIEREIFAHGALCVCHSGQCLMSSLIGGRSGNRGKCAQPCRLKYSLYENKTKQNSGYLLSPRDLSTIRILPELIECGIDSLKIEGRMKSPEYVAVTTRTYRDQLDKIKAGVTTVDPEAPRKLLQIFNRGGNFTEGYFKRHGGADMMSIETPKSTGTYIGEIEDYNPRSKRAVVRLIDDLTPGDGIEIWTQTEPHVGTGINKEAPMGTRAPINIDGNINIGDAVYKTFDKKLADELKRLITQNADNRKIKLHASARAIVGEKLWLSLKYNDTLVIESEGAECVQALKRPLTVNEFSAQLCKTGGTTFELEFENIEVGENVFADIKEINALRRNAVEKMAEKIINAAKRVADNRTMMPYHPARAVTSRLRVQVRTFEQLKSVINEKPESIIIEPEIIYETSTQKKEFFNLIEQTVNAGINIYGAFTKQLVTEESHMSVYSDINQALKGYLLRSYGQMFLALGNKEFWDKQLIADYCFNIFNTQGLKFFEEQGLQATLSPELNLGQIKELAGERSEIIIHGRLTLMTTNQCPIGNCDSSRNIRCKFKGRGQHFYLKDGQGAEFPILTDCINCTAQILNGKALFTLNKINDFRNLGAGNLRLIFTTESGVDAGIITRAYLSVLNGENTREAKALFEDVTENGAIYDGITNGHFYRGAL